MSETFFNEQGPASAEAVFSDFNIPSISEMLSDDPDFKQWTGSLDDMAKAFADQYGGEVDFYKDAIKNSSDFQARSYNNFLLKVMEAAEDRNNAFNLASARESMNFEREEAQIYRDWLEKMSNSEVSRMMSQLRAEGLNPALAYSNPASTPSASMGHGATASAATQQRSLENVPLNSKRINAQIVSSALSAITAIVTRGLALPTISTGMNPIGFR